MIEILKLLNNDKDRCVLIGRNSFNLTNKKIPVKGVNAYETTDYDIICPNLQTAKECQEILIKQNFTQDHATYTHPLKGELDIVLADPDLPSQVIGDFYNIPSLNTLWETRENVNGVLVANTDNLILNKLLYTRDNEGKDVETISIYLKTNPEKFEHLLEAVSTHKNLDEREKMLYSLYFSISNTKGLEIQKLAIEKILGLNIKEQNELFLDYPETATDVTEEIADEPFGPER